MKLAVTTTVHEHTQSNRACNIFNFAVLDFLYGFYFFFCILWFHFKYATCLPFFGVCESILIFRQTYLYIKQLISYIETLVICAPDCLNLIYKAEIFSCIGWGVLNKDIVIAKVQMLQDAIYYIVNY